jgi:uridine kinase
MIHTVVGAVQRLLDELEPPIVIALDGRSGAGKSTMAAALVDRLPATVIPTDDFFAADITNAGWDERTAAERARDAIDWRRMRESALEPLLAKRAASWHPFDFSAGTRADGTYAMAPNAVRREPAPVIILDGAYSARPELADAIDLCVLVEVAASTRLTRLAARENAAFLAAWHDRWDAAEAYYFTTVRPPTAFDLVVAG